MTAAAGWDRERSRLEDVQVPGDGLSDSDLVQVRRVCAALSVGSGLPDNAPCPLSQPARQFFANLEDQLRGLLSWRREWLAIIEAGLAETDDGG